VRRTSKPWSIASSLLALSLLASACGDDDGDVSAGDDANDVSTDEGSPDEVSAAPEGQEIVLFDGQWESLWILNEIFSVVATHGYGHTIDAPTTGTPIMMETMPAGEMHVAMEFWCMNIPDWCEAELLPEDSSVISAGTVFEEATQGWFVPRYVIEGDEERGIEPVAPDLVSVDDLAGLGEVFEDPEAPGSGMLLGGIDGWEVTEINRYKLEAYGLSDEYNFQSAGSASASDAAIVSALERGEPVLFYYWTPAWIPGVYDLVQLEEPEWTEDCQAALDAALEAELDVSESGPELGCAQPSGEVRLGATAGLEDTAPEMVAFLRNIDGNFGTQLMNELTAHMELEGAEPAETALWFFGEYDMWREWIPDEDALARVEQALRDEGIDV
jgi:glycine betaine/proline transport system substrate-binding protein